ncbi:MAG TPA: HD domain-containing phosphohydrolase [Candidatus Nitrosotalea sp.]|nr:HD domain-containing phosphohydrolase [Candidatus Nitrosotalea sp.]
MSGPPPPGALSAIDRLVVSLVAGINMRALYGADHPALASHVERILEALATACQEMEKDALTFLVVGQDLVVESQPLRTGSLYHQQFIRALARRSVERLTIALGVDTEECVRFLTPMALGGAPVSTRHIVVGRVELLSPDGRGLGLGGGGGPGQGGGPGEDSAIEALTAQSVDGARDAFTEFRTDRRGGLVRLEQVVWSLMDALQRATREILPLAPLKTHDDYTFVHSVNVSLLTLAQARSFGIEGARLHAIGLAAFLHDIGKLKIPLEVLNKPGKLEGEEWRVMMSHAQEGATHLCGVEGTHPLAILVAYEHHMRYDGQPNYPVPRVNRRPTLASQMTSISDVYDAICTTRPYAKARSREFAVKVLTERVNTFHSPALVANFVRMVGVDAPPAPPAAPGGA